MEVSGQLHGPATVSAPAHRIGGWVGPSAGLDAVAKRKNPVIVSAGNWTPVVQLRSLVSILNELARLASAYQITV
jgi:hypothetical protein